MSAVLLVNTFSYIYFRDEDDGSPVITRQGFQFLLMDRQAQVWHFLLQYLDTVQERGLNLVECLTFLFQLSFSTLGKVIFQELNCLYTNLLTFLGLQHRGNESRFTNFLATFTRVWFSIPKKG